MDEPVDELDECEEEEAEVGVVGESGGVELVQDPVDVVVTARAFARCSLAIFISHFCA